MNDEMKKEFEALRAELKKNVEAIARVDALQAKVEAGVADLKLVRGELDAIKAENGAREQTIRELREQGNIQRAAADPIRRREQGLEMLGMIVRQELARAQRTELPSHFRAETELVRGYHSQVLSRATITPMSTTGSYLVPTVTGNEIIDGLEEASDLLSRVEMITGLPAAGTINLPVVTARPAMQAKRAGTDTAMTQSDVEFGQVSLSPNESYIYFPVDNKMFLMSAIALGGWFMNICRDAMVDKLAYWLLRADGTASYNSITGILNETTAAYIYSLPGGKTSFSDLTNADLNKIKAQCYKRGRARGVWLMDLTIQGIIEDLDRTGKVPAMTFAQDGTPRIKQNPVVIDEYMPDISESAAGAALLGFGDLATFVVGMVGGLQIMSDSSYLFGKNQTAFRATTIMDMDRKPVPTFIVGKTAAQ